MARLLDADSAKIHRHRIHGCFCGAHGDAGHAANLAIRAVSCHQLRGRTAGQGTHDAHGKNFRGHPDQAGDGTEDCAENLHRAGSTEIPMATSMATRYGMMRTAVVKPSFAPSTKAA